MSDTVRLALALLLIAALGAAGRPASRARDEQPARPRARALGLQIGDLPTGPHNDITDVPGVRVGHFTLKKQPRFNTGITAILPHDKNLFHEKVPAAVVVGNGFGKLVGMTQVNELGELETPILLTGTLNVPRVADGLISYMLSLPGMEQVYSINPVVGETNDGFLSDIRARPLGADEVRRAIEDASTQPVAMGAVGAGAGTVCFGFKGGIGSASRRLADTEGGWTVGVLVQTNFGGPLRIEGLPSRIEGTPLGEFLQQQVRTSAATGGAGAGGAGTGGVESAGVESDAAGTGDVGAADVESYSARTGGIESGGAGANGPTPRSARIPGADGSLMIVVATDAPLDHRNLQRLARRSLHGMARTGGFGSNGSGDYAIAFTTHEALRIRRGNEPQVMSRPVLDNSAVTPLFLAVSEATEEAIVDSLFTARTTVGHRGTVPALPVEKVLELAGSER